MSEETAIEMRYRIDQAYRVMVCGVDLSDLASRVVDAIAGRRALICTTPSVHRLYEPFFAQIRLRSAHVEIVVLDAGEAKKGIAAVLDICARAKAFELGRRDLLVAVGGGVCSDLVRTAAALVRRGIPHLCVPTTLIGQVDAGIGVKGAINFLDHKSYLGVFAAPEAVLVSPGFLATVPRAALRDGMAEVLKVACTSDAALFGLVESAGPLLVESGFRTPGAAADRIVRRAIELTLEALALDPLERGSLRRTLDFGHTFSPLIEARSGFAISHGAAVAIDICLSAWIAAALGRLAASEAERIVAAVRSMGLRSEAPLLSVELMRAAIEGAVQHRGGSANLVIPVAIGQCDFVSDAALLTPRVLESALARLCNEARLAS